MAKKDNILGTALIIGLAWWLWPKGNTSSAPANNISNSSPATNTGTLTPTQFVNLISADATAVETAVQVPHLVVEAVAALESGWGSSALAVQGNNYFGIEADSSWTGPTFMVSGQPFRKYASMTDSAIDFGNYLRANSNYDNAFTTTDPATFATAVAAGGYGGADVNYASKLVALIQQLQTMGQ